MRNKLLLLSFIASLTLLFSCGEDSDSTPIQSVDKDVVEKADSTRANIFNIGGELFSIPSPIQTAFLIKKSGADFNKEILNSPKNTPNYSTKFKKAVNLGIYGADLGYVTLYDNTQDALSYLNSVQQLSDELGVTGAFNKELIERFSENVGNQDSMLVLVSDAYRAGDSYLKDNKRHDVAALILAGGWIESLYFSINIVEQTNDASVIRRIGEQKTSLENLLNLLYTNYEDQDIAALADQLADLKDVYEGIEYTYVFEKPTIKAAKKRTVINSKTEVKVTDEQLKEISKQVRSIRENLIS